MLTLSTANQEVTIGEGELLSYRAEGHEFMHQKGSPGWRNTDTEMFPVIGPTADAGYRVQVPKGNAIQDQHGLLREMQYEMDMQSDHTVRFVKKYTAGNLVKNSKYPDKSKIQWLLWPYSFTFEKTFVLQDNSLLIHFDIQGDKEMPFMLGYHPAFKLYSKDPVIHTEDGDISLEQILAVGNRALEVRNVGEISLSDVRKLTLKTIGFHHFMLWTEVPNMLCIEPITFYPYTVGQHQLHTGFEYLRDSVRRFSVALIPGPSDENEPFEL